MSVLITFKILKPLSQNEIQDDANFLLTLFSNWYPIMQCPGDGMDLIAYYEKDKDELMIFFSRLIQKTEAGYKPGYIDCFVLEITQLMIRQSLRHKYEVAKAHVDCTLQINGNFDTSEGFLLRKNSREIATNSVVASCPGILITLQLLPTADFSQGVMEQDAERLTKKLNRMPHENRDAFMDTSDQIIPFPAITCGVERRSFCIGIIYPFHDISMVENFNRLRETVLAQLTSLTGTPRYRIATIKTTNDILSTPNHSTENEEILKSCGINFDSVPSQYLCGLSGYVIDSAVRIPDFDGVVDEATCARLLATSDKNPFTGKPLRRNQLIHDHQLTAEIAYYVTKKCNQSTTSLDPLEEEATSKKQLRSIKDHLQFYLNEFIEKNRATHLMAENDFLTMLKLFCDLNKDDVLPPIKTLIMNRKILGIDINKQGERKRTLLHDAAINKNELLFHILMRYEANDTLLDENGNTPADYARLNNFNGYRAENIVNANVPDEKFIPSIKLKLKNNDARFFHIEPKLGAYLVGHSDIRQRCVNKEIASIEYRSVTDSLEMVRVIHQITPQLQDVADALAKFALLLEKNPPYHSKLKLGLVTAIELVIKKTGEIAVNISSREMMFEQSPQAERSSPIHVSGNAHASLTNRAAAILGPNAENHVFMQSLSKSNYSQALRRACTTENKELALKLVTLLLEYKNLLSININEKAGATEYTALHYAAKNSPQLYNLLIEHGADHTTLGTDNLSPAQIFLDQGHVNRTLS